MRVRCVQAKRCRGTLTLRRLRKGKRSLLLGSKRASLPARRTRTIVVTVRRSRLGSAPQAAGAHGSSPAATPPATAGE